MTAPQKPSLEDLVAALEAEVKDGPIKGGYAGFALVPFAKILVLLANRAEATARSVVGLTKALLVLTVALLLLTALLAGEALYKDYKSSDLKTDRQPISNNVKR